MIISYILEGKLFEKLLGNVSCFLSPKSIADSIEVDVTVVYRLIKTMLLQLDGISLLILVSNFFDESILDKFSNCYAFVASNRELKFSCLLVEYYYRRELVKFETKVTSPSTRMNTN